MARTPLLKSLIQLARDARASHDTGIPVDELREIRARRRLSRRNFLAGAAAGAAVLAMPKVARAANQPKVIIIGGGIAGLNCALTLRDKGYTSTVYEASGRLGGRMFSNNNGYWAGNQVSEWCGELIDTAHHNDPQSRRALRPCRSTTCSPRSRTERRHLLRRRLVLREVAGRHRLRRHVRHPRCRTSTTRRSRRSTTRSPRTGSSSIR